MVIDVILPKIGMAMQDALIVEWIKKVGDSVTKGEVLLKMETEKVVEELEAQETGVLEVRLHLVRESVALRGRW